LTRGGRGSEEWPTPAAGHTGVVIGNFAGESATIPVPPVLCDHRNANGAAVLLPKNCVADSLPWRRRGNESLIIEVRKFANRASCSRTEHHGTTLASRRSETRHLVS